MQSKLLRLNDKAEVLILPLLSQAATVLAFVAVAEAETEAFATSSAVKIVVA